MSRAAYPLRASTRLLLNPLDRLIKKLRSLGLDGLGLLQHPQTGRWGVAVYVAAGGYGARAGSDGPSALYVRQGSGLRSVPLEILEARYADISARFDGRPVDRPPFWGGFRVVPERIEFWYGRPGRLHERILYTKTNGRWRTS